MASRDDDTRPPPGTVPIMPRYSPLEIRQRAREARRDRVSPDPSPEIESYMPRLERPTPPPRPSPPRAASSRTISDDEWSIHDPEGTPPLAQDPNSSWFRRRPIDRSPSPPRVPWRPIGVAVGTRRTNTPVSFGEPIRTHSASTTAPSRTSTRVPSASVSVPYQGREPSESLSPYTRYPAASHTLAGLGIRTSDAELARALSASPSGPARPPTATAADPISRFAKRHSPTSDNNDDDDDAGISGRMGCLSIRGSTHGHRSHTAVRQGKINTFHR